MADANVYRYSSQDYHERSGLYGYGLRFYEPRLGRWLNGDPLRDGGGINLYTAFGGDPINNIDPWGLFNTGVTVRIIGEILSKPGTAQAIRIGAGRASGVYGWVAGGGYYPGDVVGGLGYHDALANRLVDDVGSSPIPLFR